jgi:hypothetical protein
LQPRFAPASRTCSMNFAMIRSRSQPADSDRIARSELKITPL